MTIIIKIKGIGLLVIPSLISDLILLNLTKKKKFYKSLKEYDYKDQVENSTNKEKQIVEKRLCFG
jgi:hypothetical protein